MSFWSFFNKNNNNAETIIADASKLDESLNKEKTIEIQETIHLRKQMNVVKETLHEGEQAIDEFLHDADKNIFNESEADNAVKIFVKINKNENLIVGAADTLITTCKFAAETDTELKTKIKSSKWMEYGIDAKKEAEELKTLHDDEIMILNSAVDLRKRMKDIVEFSKIIASLDDDFNVNESKEKFINETKKIKTQFSEMNALLSKAEADVDNIDKILKRVVIIVNEVDVRLHASAEYITKRITRGYIYKQ